MSWDVWCVFYAIFWVMFRFQLFCHTIFQRSRTTVLQPIWKLRYLLWLCPFPIWALHCICILILNFTRDDNRFSIQWVPTKIACSGYCYIGIHWVNESFFPPNFKAWKLYHYCNFDTPACLLIYFGHYIKFIPFPSLF